MKGKLSRVGNRLLSSLLITALLLSGFAFTDAYYGTGSRSYAAELTGSSATVSAPNYNSANMPTMDTTGTVGYWYAGNKFLALNQFNGGADSTQASKSITVGSTATTNGTMPIYDAGNSNARVVETTNSNSERNDNLALKTNYSSITDAQTFVQAQSDSFFEDGSVWELMDSDAVWDDDYLFAQYYSRSFDAQTSAFPPSILTNVESWYDNGFSYSTGGGAAVSAQGSYFSDAEKENVKSATVTTDGVGGSSNTSSNDTITAHLFAPSLDEIYYNPQQVASIFNAFSADSSAGRTTNTSWQYPRSHLWLRSFWGVSSSLSGRNGVSVYSTGALYGSNVASEFAVAPAFYLDTKGVVMAKDATNATAEAVATASSLAQYSASATDDNKSVKFLVADSTLAPDFTTTVSQKKVGVEAGETYSINYSGAVTETDAKTDAGNQNDSKLVISAIIYDENGKILYYGNLGEVSSESGSVNLTIPAIAEETNYTLAIFEEQIGGTSKYKTSGNVTYTSYETDYQSGNVSYSKLVCEQAENATGFDSNSWYEYEDSVSGIVWKYKLNSNGDVIGLYTESTDISSIIDSGKCLNVPSKINGRTVIAIGGEDADHPFILPSLKGWTSISFPSSLTTINDYAFMDTDASAKIVIPSHVTAIGIKAFYGSDISSVVLSEFTGTVGSYAFASTDKLTTVTIKGGGSGLTLSSVTFADSALTDVSITGNVTVNKKAFRGNTKLKNVSLNGNITLNESAFSGCTAVNNLNISGSVRIGSYAFDGCTALESVYLPAGTTLSAYAFNGCTGITSLEADCSLPSHSFENTGNITLIVLDSTCASVAADWEGNVTNFAGETGSVVISTDSYASSYNIKEFTNPGRTVYARSSNTLYGFKGSSPYLSAFGNSGTVQVYIPYDANYNTGIEVKTGESLSLFGMSLYSDSSYDDYKNAGGATNVMVSPVGNIATLLDNKDITVLADETTEKTQTGISAYYTGTILTTKDIDKDSMTVTKMYGAEEGEAYTSDQFYVIRTSEFNTELASQTGVTEEKIASYEPISAKDSDLADGQSTGTISATVVVFYDADGTAKYFSAPVSIRVEEYSAKSYIEQAYGSYDAVAAAFVEYENRIADLEKALGEADVDSIDSLTKELAACKIQYAELVELLASYVSDNTTDETGYFGTTTDGSGNTKDVVFIEGNATEYTDTNKTDDNGKKIYSASYDADGDGTPETIYFTVQEDGIHLTDEDGNAVKVDGSAPADGESGAILADKLGALQRQLTAQINDLKAQLDSCDAGLAKVKASITNAGLDYDDLDGETDYDKISNAIDTLTTDLSAAQSKIDSYQNALNVIYNKLTGEDLSAEDAASLSSALTAINSKIEKLNSDLSVAQATVADLKAKLSDAESELTNLTNELESTKNSLEETESALSQAQSDLETAKQEKADLTAQYEKALADGDEEAAAELKEQIDAKNAAIEELETTQKELENTKTTLTQKEQDLAAAKDTVALLQKQIEEKESEIATLQAQVEALSSTADGYKVTVSVANTLFDAGLSDDATAEDISNAVNEYVKQKLSNDETIKAIQELVGSTNTGSDLVADVSNAIGSGSGNDSKSGTVDYTGYTKDTEVNTSSSSYTAGVSAGKSSVDTSSYYNNGYSEGYSAGVKAAGSSNNNSSNSTQSYNNGYSAGYSAGVTQGKNSVNTSEYYNNGYNTGYSEGKKAGVASVDTSATSSTYKSGYNAGYADGEKAGESKVSSRSTTTSTTSATSGTTSSRTASTGSTSGTNTTASTGSASNSASSNKPQSTSESTEDEEELEGSTIGINATGTSNGSTKTVELGTVSQRSLPVTITTDSTQKAVVTLHNLPAENSVVLTTNAASASEQASSQEKNNAYKIVDYYKNNLKELGALGSDEIMNAATNDNMEVTFDILASVNVEASEDQKTAIANGEEFDLTLSSADFEEGALYLVIHESDVREGEFDVMLSGLENGVITMPLKDLSPVTITKVSVSTVQGIDEAVEEDTIESESPKEITEETNNKPFAWVAYLLIVVAVGFLVVLFIGIKKRGGFKKQ